MSSEPSCRKATSLVHLMEQLENAPDKEKN